MPMPAKAPHPNPINRPLSKPGRTETGGDAISMIETWSAPSTTCETSDFFQIVRQAVIQSFQAIDFAFDAIELREALAQIERFGFPFLDVGLQVFHLFADGFAARGQFLDGILAK